MSEPGTHRHEFAEVHPEALLPDRLAIEDLREVRLIVSADLGQAVLLVRDIVELRRGSVVPLNKLAGELTDIYINDVPMAKGEVVVIADTIHVRVAEVAGVVDQEKEMGEDDD